MARKRNDGLRARVANAISDFEGGGRKRGSQGKNLAQRAASDLTDAATDIRRRLTGGETKRSITARKGVATRKRNAAKRSAAAKQGARTRAKAKR
jgi:hypothetical protein